MGRSAAARSSGGLPAQPPNPSTSAPGRVRVSEEGYLKRQWGRAGERAPVTRHGGPNPLALSMVFNILLFPFIWEEFYEMSLGIFLNG